METVLLNLDEWIVLDQAAQWSHIWCRYYDTFDGEEVVRLYQLGFLRVDWKNHQMQITESGLEYRRTHDMPL